jgi:membrane protein implicated in regulation of membrane protease activity
MYLVAIAWMYVVVMMSVAEATAANGTVLGAVVTFVFYGVLPCVILMYLMGTPMRRKALRAQEKNEREVWPEQTSPQTLTGQNTTMSPSALQPDTSSHTATDVIAPVREKP